MVENALWVLCATIATAFWNQNKKCNMQEQQGESFFNIRMMKQ